VKDVFAIPENIRGVLPTSVPDQPLPRDLRLVRRHTAGESSILSRGLEYSSGRSIVRNSVLRSTVPNGHDTDCQLESTAERSSMRLSNATIVLPINPDPECIAQVAQVQPQIQTKSQIDGR